MFVKSDYYEQSGMLYCTLLVLSGIDINENAALFAIEIQYIHTLGTARSCVCDLSALHSLWRKTRQDRKYT